MSLLKLLDASLLRKVVRDSLQTSLGLPGGSAPDSYSEGSGKGDYYSVLSDLPFPLRRI